MKHIIFKHIKSFSNHMCIHNIYIYIYIYITIISNILCIGEGDMSNITVSALSNVYTDTLDIDFSGDKVKIITGSVTASLSQTSIPQDAGDGGYGGDDDEHPYICNVYIYM